MPGVRGGGPDLTRRIWPVVMSVTDEGTRRLPDEEVGAVEVEAVEEADRKGGAVLAGLAAEARHRVLEAVGPLVGGWLVAAPVPRVLAGDDEGRDGRPGFSRDGGPRGQMPGGGHLPRPPGGVPVAPLQPANCGFTAAWSEVLFALMLIRSEDSMTFPVGMLTFVSKFSVDWGQMMAAGVLALIPSCLVCAFLRRYLVQGLTSGAVKG